MAVPLVPLVSGALAFFGHIFKKYVIEGALRIASVTTIISLNLSFITLFIVALLSFANIILFIFNKINEFFDFINAYLLNGSSDELTSVALNVLSTLGFFRAFADVFNLFSPVIVSLFVYIVSKLLWVLVFHIRNSVLAVII